MDVKRYPLCWPLAQPRTRVRKRSKFGGKAGRWSFGQARDDLLGEIDRLRATHVVLSTNVELRLDGIPYANRSEPDDPGVAVYFRRKGKPYVIACDTYDRIADNCRAITLTIDSLRRIERHGSSALLEQAFSGFSALPPARTGIRPWREVLEISLPGSALVPDRQLLQIAEQRYRRLSHEHHPDRGGDHERMAEINDAIRRAREELR